MTGLASLARPKIPGIAVAAVFMAVGALATAGYAFLVGPVLRSFFHAGGRIAGEVQIPGAGFMADAAQVLARSDVTLVALLIVAAAVVKGLSFFLQRLFVVNAGQGILVSLRSRVYAGLLRSNPLMDRLEPPGELVTRFAVDAQEVEEAITGGLLAALRDGLQVVALVALAVVLDPALGLVGIIAFPPIAVLIHRFGKALRRRRRKVYDAFGDLGSTVEETAKGLSIIRSFGAEEVLDERFSGRNLSLAGRSRRALLLKAVTSPLNEILAALALGATLIYAHHRVSEGTVSPEAFISFFTALVLLYQPIKGLSQANHSVQSGLAALSRLTSLMERSNRQDTQGIRLDLEHGRVPKVELVDVFARYPAGEDVLEAVSLEIPSGAKVAIVGPSGVGKSTLVNILCGHLEARRGEIRVDDERVRMTPGVARRIFSPVPQEPFLFDDTIEMNVRCGRPNATGEDVLAACEAAGVTRFTGELKLGISHPVGRGGSELSVGQRQRVCLARALLSQAPVLLMDEVTASLDGVTERAVSKTLEGCLAGRSMLVVTHRRSTAGWADRVVLLKDGQVRAEGRLEELMKTEPELLELFEVRGEKEDENA